MSGLTVADLGEGEADITVCELTELSFGGCKSKTVMPGEFFTTDPVRLSFNKGEYICLEISFCGKMIPYHEESLLPIFIKDGDEWSYSRRMPLAAMVGCKREVVARIGYLGDSITQGYDALRPSNRYAAKLANFLSAEERCKGIGGEGFFPELARSKDDGYDPDYISVAYGTNDWSHAVSREELTARCLEFYTALRETYPRAKIFAISPIWRKDEGKYSAFGTFDEMQRMVAAVAESLPEVYFISGYDAVPHDETYFADLYLHPNDRGFDHYAENICAQVKKYV
jgi:lysophospholipase L1-like esterase